MREIFNESERNTVDQIYNFAKSLTTEQQERLYGFILAAKFLEDDKEKVS